MHIDNPILPLLDLDDALCALRTRVNSERAEDAINLAIRLKNVRRNFVSTASVLIMHEAPDCTVEILCSICKDSSHLAKNCPCGWISPREAPPSSQPAEPDLQPTQPASPQNSSLQSSQSSQYSSSSQSSSSPASVSPSSPSFSPIAETLHGDDSADANMENVPVPPLAINPMTASDD